MSYISLHTHSLYSIHDACCRIKELVKAAKEQEMNAVALTDHGVMYGVIDLYHACMDAGIKPILGFEAYVAPGSRKQKNPDEKYEHLVLLAKNNEGYHNISMLCTEGFGEGYYYKPRIDDELLEKYHEGVIALSACVAGRIPQKLIKGDYEGAKSAALYYRDLFGAENFYLEIQDHGLADERTVISGILKIHEETGIPLVATNDVHYIKKEDWEARDALLCMSQNKLLTDTDRMADKEHEYYFKTEEEMNALFPYAKEAVENTQKIADMCSVEITFHDTKMPQYPVPDGLSAYEYLSKLCDKGFEERYGNLPEEKKKAAYSQMQYQLQVIKQMGYVEYFLIVWDYINWARENGIPVGPGRGSAAGALVTYCIKITDIDPLRYDLQFERFLNPERVSMPDIDVDFEVRGRQRVIDHCKDLYGQENVVQIITFGRMTARDVIKDTGRVMGYPYKDTDRLAKMVPTDVGITIEKAMQQSPDFKAAYDGEEETKKLIDLALRLEGLPKSIGTHAAGVIISRLPTREYIPLCKNADGTSMVSQFTMTTVEELGLLKMDFLGLRTLSVEQDAIINIKENQGIDFDIEAINYEDPSVYAHISSGQTSGMFQLESQGMQSFMKQLKPESLEDLTAGISLYRPGPMDYIPQYIKGKNNKDDLSYECPELEPILKPTYACIVYQEQVTRIVRDLAGYSMGAADNIRRAMSKKKQYVIDAERQTFVNGDESRNIPGCVKNGIKAEIANEIYDHMVAFAKYAFNKSHAACYAYISYQTAYLMHYYPVEYWAAVMTSVINNSSKLTEYIQSARAAGVPLLPPDINHSRADYAADGKSIRFALAGLKGISHQAAEAIVADRTSLGLYKDLPSCLDRLTAAGIDKSGIENLILSGAMDCFKGNRRQKYIAFPLYLDSKKKEQKKNITGQMSLFDLLSEKEREEVHIMPLPDCPEFSEEELLKNEKSVAGIYLSGHPLDRYASVSTRINNIKTTDFAAKSEEEGGGFSITEDQSVKGIMMVSSFKKHFTKKGDPMAFLSLEDLYGEVNAVVFPKVFERAQALLFEDAILLIEGHVSIDAEKGASIIIDNIKGADALKREVWVRFATEDECEAFRADLGNFPAGNDRIVTYVAETKKKRIAGNNSSVSDIVMTDLIQRYGVHNVAEKICEA